MDWVSINLLCVVCIHCSGVHRSMGSHISKIRSLNMDDLHSNPELKYLLSRHVINKNVNAIYEATLPPEMKIDKDVSADRRSQFIMDKYMAKKYVTPNRTADMKQTNTATTDQVLLDLELQGLVQAIQSNSIYMIQSTIASAKHSLKVLCLEYGLNKPTLFQLSLEHFYVFEANTPIYYLTEFLLLNGLLIDDESMINVAGTELTPTAKLYWTSRHSMYTTYSHAILNNSSDTMHSGNNSSANSVPKRSSTVRDSKRRLHIDTQSSPFEFSRSNGPLSAALNKKRWSLASPTNLLSIHRSMSRRDANKKP